MTSGQESSQGPLPSPPKLESLAGVFHPHAIGVQDFVHYRLVIDIRSPAAFGEDHIPGAVRVDPMAAEGGPRPSLPRALLARVSRFQPEAAILVYCGRGGIDSEALAQMLRQHGREVDVLPGGWINYRRWVLAGLDILPRLIMFQIIAAPPKASARSAMQAMAAQGLQVLDVEALADHEQASSRVSGRPASQAWFESLLLRAMRQFDPGRPVWVDRRGPELGLLGLPAALREALQTAPEAPPQSRQC
jgi:tRNA 2-selenouridine synthase